MRSLFRLLLLSCSLSLPLPTAAAEPLTFAQTLAVAAEKNPSLAAQAYQERAAGALIDQASVRPIPTLDVTLENALGTGRLQGVRSLETTVQASQVFERGDKLAKRVTLATRERDTIAREFAVRRTEVLASAATAFVAALAAQQRLALAAEPLRLARETLALIETRARAGAASSLESTRARAAVIAADADFTRAESAAAAARRALVAAWGGDTPDPAAPALSGQLLTPAALPAEAPLRARLAAHPQLDLQSARIATHRAAADLAQTRTTSDITASGGVRFIRDGTDAAFVAGLSVPFPTRQTNQGNLRAARETLAGAELAARAVERELRLAFNAAWQDLVAAHALAKKLRHVALPVGEEALTAVRLAYAAGSVPLTDVLDARRALAALQLELLAADTDYALALVRLEALTDSAFPLTAALLVP
jgi:cobalt-zinc-cadmium efflux system outer membrane protein